MSAQEVARDLQTIMLAAAAFFLVFLQEYEAGGVWMIATVLNARLR